MSEEDYAGRFIVEVTVRRLDGKKITSSAKTIPWHGATFLVPTSMDEALIGYAMKMGKEVMRDAIEIERRVTAAGPQTNDSGEITNLPPR